MRANLGPQFDRRAFLGRCLPVCAVSCMGLSSIPLFGMPSKGGQQSPARHKFDAEMPNKLTLRQLFAQRYGSIFIPYIKFCSQSMGLDKTVEMLEAYAAASAPAAAANAAKRLGSNDLEAAKKYFDPANPNFAGTLTFTVPESTDKAFQLHITECLWATTFLEAKAGDLGYAAVCFGDFQLAKSFNPRLELVRTKTLMQGDDCCNHRYLFKA
jgi:hypothetical protein